MYVKKLFSEEPMGGFNLPNPLAYASDYNVGSILHCA